ncbi:D-alanyl-D-alanine carboxypeptidase/D-alanyl-D-alanine-endopeptidase [Polaromonas vacuolata]|nr:D-alanyl-D-alanine carboxypeptidase/D-alanyl-D-alanine-endopeptidase [Polaromonas vacuolata]
MLFNSCNRQRMLRHLTLGLLTCGISAAALAQSQTSLPAEVRAALERARLPQNAMAALVLEATPTTQGSKTSPTQPLLSWRADASMNPASVMKLVTTYASLELLGPSYSWKTPVYLDGSISNGVLHGNLVIQGRGDPKLVMERLWLLLHRVQSLGVQRISGDIVLDRSAFAPNAQDPGDFDGEPLRPYNASPDALLINYKSVLMTFTPQPSRGLASISMDPPLANLTLQTSVPLATGKDASACGNYRATLAPDFSSPDRIRFLGSYPPACGEKVWPLAYADPDSFAARAVLGLWQDMGGKLDGRVRDGQASAGLMPAFEMTSPSLAEVIQNINKYSNNVMAQQLFLTLSLAPITTQVSLPASISASREVLAAWWRARFGEQDLPLMDNGSGLSRQARITPQALGRMLQAAYASTSMPELMASLPIAGVDGTLKRNLGQPSEGLAHLKTGSLRDVTALAGYVHLANGRRLVVVAMINHANAGAGKPALDALVEWALREGKR